MYDQGELYIRHSSEDVSVSKPLKSQVDFLSGFLWLMYLVVQVITDSIRGSCLRQDP